MPRSLSGLMVPVRLAGLIMLISACASSQPAQVASVVPDFETEPVANEGDAADDPAILVDGPVVRILGTNKRAGLALYDLTGAERTFLASGRVNNVDALPLEPGLFLAAASNRTETALDLYRIDTGRDRIELLLRQPLDMIDPYGLCMGQTPEMSVFVGDKEGKVERWVLQDEALELQQTLQFDGQTEGCVYDPVDGVLYVGEEERGIWAVNLNGDESRHLLAATDGADLVADVEGLDIYRDDQGRRFLIASSQGDDSYLIYSLPGGRKLLKFRVVDDPAAGLDGSQETDGLAVTSQSLPGYPGGLLVVQDGENAPDNQNFKGIDWRRIEALVR